MSEASCTRKITQVGMLPRQVIDPVEDYLKLIHKIYDFGALRKLLARKDFNFTFDGMHGVAGPYAQRIFVKARLPVHLPNNNAWTE